MSKLKKAARGDLLEELNNQRDSFLFLADRTKKHSEKILALIDKVVEEGDDPYYYMTHAEREWLRNSF